MISALSWVKKGAALEKPEKVELSEEEFERIQKEMGVQLMDAKQDYNQVCEEEHADGPDEDRESLANSMETVDIKNALNPNTAAATVADGEVEIAKGDNKQDLSIYNLDNYDDEQEDNMIDEETLEGPSGIY